PGRLARHRHQRKPLRPRLPDRPVQRLTQPERLHPHRLTRQHPHIMINHRDRLLVLRQVNPDHRAITRQHRPQPLPPRVPPTIPPGHAATLAHRDVLSGCAWDTKPALSHQEDVPASTASPTTGASSALSYYYARVLLCIAHDPGARLRDIAASLGITERSAHGIVTDLDKAGYVIRQKDGRR